MTDKSIIRLCEMCFKPTQDDECIHYPDQLNDRPIVKYRVIEFIPLTAIKSLIRERIEAKKKWDFSKDHPLIKAGGESIQQALIEKLQSLLTHLEEMEKS